MVFVMYRDDRCRGHRPAWVDDECSPYYDDNTPTLRDGEWVYPDGRREPVGWEWTEGGADAMRARLVAQWVKVMPLLTPEDA
ncbi:hypothetical protein D3C83_172920 [compost metagenome]